MFPEAAAAFHRRLDPAARRPITVAVSGGGDSIAALIATMAWAKGVGRPVIVLCVDHGLQVGSDRWTAFAGETAHRLGAGFRALKWAGEKPKTGLPAAARAARHRLLANAARDAGADVIVTGHTADDGRENALMGLGALYEWSPSPVWPEGRDLFLLRPLLGFGRAAIRETLAARGFSWIDDPANADLSHPRIRARQSGEDPAAVSSPDGEAADLARRISMGDGAFRLARQDWRAASPTAERRVLAAALTCAGGGERPPRGASLDALLDRLRSPASVTATLAGAKLIADEAHILIVRNAGESARGGLATTVLPQGETVIWDGRYVLKAADSGLTVQALKGHIKALPPGEKARLAAMPPAVRPSLPFITGPGVATCPILAEPPSPVWFRPLAAHRFLAACGAIAQEKDVEAAVHGATGFGVLCCRPALNETLR